MRFALAVVASLLMQFAAFAVALERYLNAPLSSASAAVVRNPLVPSSLEEVFLMASGIAFLLMTLGLVWVMVQARYGFAYMLSMGTAALLWQVAVRVLRADDVALQQAGVCVLFSALFIAVTWRLLASVSKPMPTRS